MNTTPEREVWDELITNSRRIRYRIKEFILRQGEPGNHVVIILDGQVKVQRVESNGECNVLAFRGSQEVLGRTAVLWRRRRFASVEALTSCQVACVPADVYCTAMARTALAAQAVAHAHERLLESMVVQGNGHPCTRLAFAVARLSERSQGDARPDERAMLCFTRLDLSRHLGVGRNTLSELLKQLEPFGVDTGRNSITIRDLPALRAFASELEI
jgi:CRP-like cAMP-binding protein